MEIIIHSVHRLASIEWSAQGFVQSKELMSAILSRASSTLFWALIFHKKKPKRVGATWVLPSDGMYVDEIILADTVISMNPIQVQYPASI